MGGWGWGGGIVFFFLFVWGGGGGRALEAQIQVGLLAMLPRPNRHTSGLRTKRFYRCKG